MNVQNFRYIENYRKNEHSFEICLKFHEDFKIIRNTNFKCFKEIQRISNLFESNYEW